jgi:hypothetical protein
MKAGYPPRGGGASKVGIMVDSEEQDRIRAAFGRIRYLRRWLAAILLTYLPMTALFYSLRVSLWLFLAACALWVFAGITIAVKIGLSICPVCRQYFHVRGMEGSTFAKECINCGIRLSDP